MTDMDAREPAGGQTFHADPAHTRGLTALREHAAPEPRDGVTKRRQRRCIARHAAILSFVAFNEPDAALVDTDSAYIVRQILEFIRVHVVARLDRFVTA